MGKYDLTDRMKSRLKRVTPTEQELFFDLITQLSPFCERHYATNVPDYRLFKKFVFCILIPMIIEPTIRVYLRSDDIQLSSAVFHITQVDMTTSGRPGKMWVEFDVQANTEYVSESVRLVSYVASKNIELVS